MANKTRTRKTPRLKLTIAATAAILSGCASSGPTRTPLVPETVTQVADGVFTIEIFNKPGVGARMVPAPIDSVWDVLGEVYQRLEIPVALRLPAQRVLGNRAFRARRIEGKRLSTYLDCGRGMTSVPYADEYAVTMLTLTQLSRGDAGGTTVETTVDGWAKPRAVSGDPLHCASRGSLELRVAQLVVELLGVGVRSDTTVHPIR